MKKLIFIFVVAFSASLFSCGKSTTTEITNDSVEVVDTIVTDTVTIDTVA